MQVQHHPETQSKRCPCQICWRRTWGLDARACRRHPVHLPRQSSEVLSYLVDRLGEIVSKDDLFENVWAKTVVADEFGFSFMHRNFVVWMYGGL